MIKKVRADPFVMSFWTLYSRNSTDFLELKNLVVVRAFYHLDIMHGLARISRSFATKVRAFVLLRHG